MQEDIISHYAQIQEEERLLTGSGALEYARSQELIDRYLPPLPAVILDVGGGPGAYSCWLAGKGYEVHLIEPSPKHVAQATKASLDQPDHPIASVSEGDARSLDHGDASCDAVLLMGPLYHLTTRDDRITALREAHRVVRPGGLVFSVAINRFASLMDGLEKGFIDDPYFVEILERDLTDGQHRNPRNVLDYFTTTFFHRPEELEAEVREAGFTVTEVVAIQGPGWLAKDFTNRWSAPERRAQLLNLVRAVEHEPSLLGVSQHFMIIAKK